MCAMAGLAMAHGTTIATGNSRQMIVPAALEAWPAIGRGPVAAVRHAVTPRYE